MKRLRQKNYYDFEWKKNPNAVYVGRPNKYGNPFKLTEYSLSDSLTLFEFWLQEQLTFDPDFLKELVDKDLVCFCPLDQPCHADILLKYINEIYKPKDLCISSFNTLDRYTK